MKWQTPATDKEMTALDLGERLADGAQSESEGAASRVKRRKADFDVQYDISPISFTPINRRRSCVPSTTTVFPTCTQVDQAPASTSAAASSTPQVPNGPPRDPIVAEYLGLLEPSSVIPPSEIAQSGERFISLLAGPQDTGEPEATEKPAKKAKKKATRRISDGLRVSKPRTAPRSKNGGKQQDISPSQESRLCDAAEAAPVISQATISKLDAFRCRPRGQEGSTAQTTDVESRHHRPVLPPTDSPAHDGAPDNDRLTLPSATPQRALLDVTENSGSAEDCTTITNRISETDLEHSQKLSGLPSDLVLSDFSDALTVDDAHQPCDSRSDLVPLPGDLTDASRHDNLPAQDDLDSDFAPSESMDALMPGDMQQLIGPSSNITHPDTTEAFNLDNIYDDLADEDLFEVDNTSEIDDDLHAALPKTARGNGQNNMLPSSVHTDALQGDNTALFVPTSSQSDIAALLDDDDDWIEIEDHPPSPDTMDLTDPSASTEQCSDVFSTQPNNAEVADHSGPGTKELKAGKFAVQPIARPPFPSKVRDRSPIIGISSTLLLRTCFRIGEALNVGTQAYREGRPILIELYARVSSSWREPDSVKQHFVFCDIFHDRPPFINAVYEVWKGVDLWDYDSSRFLNPQNSKPMCRCIGKLKREENKWKMIVLNIWEATWDDVNWVSGIIYA